MRSRSTAAPTAGAVRVRPTGEVAPRSGTGTSTSSPGTAPRRRPSPCGRAAVRCARRPCAAIAPNAGSVATSQVTGTVGPRPDPGVACGVGVTRVQRTTASGSGSPEATPCAKTVGAAPAGPAAETTAAPTRAVPVVAAPSCSRDRRLRGSITVCLLTETAGGCARHLTVHRAFRLPPPSRAGFARPSRRCHRAVTGTPHASRVTALLQSLPRRPDRDPAPTSHSRLARTVVGHSVRARLLPASDRAPAAAARLRRRRHPHRPRRPRPGDPPAGPVAAGGPVRRQRPRRPARRSRRVDGVPGHHGRRHGDLPRRRPLPGGGPGRLPPAARGAAAHRGDRRHAAG